MLVKRIDAVNDEPYVTDTTTGVMFRRTVGALAWPADPEQGVLLCWVSDGIT